jgi:hypothetical protein
MISIEPSCYQQSNISFVYIPFTVILTSNQFFGNHYQLRSHISLYRFYTKRKHSSLFIHSSLKIFLYCSKSSTNRDSFTPQAEAELTSSQLGHRLTFSQYTHLSLIVLVRLKFFLFFTSAEIFFSPPCAICIKCHPDDGFGSSSSGICRNRRYNYDGVA